MDPIIKKKATMLSDDLYKYDEDLSDKEINHLKNILGDDFGHSSIHSYSQTDVDIMNRMLISKKSIDGKFTSERHMWDAVRSLIDYNCERIIDETDRLLPNQNVTYTVPDLGSFDDQPLGNGFIKINGFYHKFESDNMSIVLKQDPNCKYGFHLQTAFPGECEKVSGQKTKLKLTKGDFSGIMKQTEYYKKASPAEKAYLEYMSNSNNEYDLYMSKGNIKNGYRDTLTLKKTNEDGTAYKAYITHDEIRVSKFDQNDKPIPTPIAQIQHRSRLALDTDDDKKMFAKFEPDYTKAIVNLQNRITKHMSKQSQREIPNIEVPTDYDMMILAK